VKRRSLKERRDEMDGRRQRVALEKETVSGRDGETVGMGAMGAMLVRHGRESERFLVSQVYPRQHLCCEWMI